MNFSNLFEKTGVLATITASMSCGFCFPLLASLGASLGIGFLSEYEGFFIQTLIPVLAGFIIAMQAYAYFNHKQHLYLFFGLIGPVTILILKYFFWMATYRTEIYYLALICMLCYSIFTLFKPPYPLCKIKMEMK
ncbi:MerC family mercury resistance protein [Psychromonas hadalis]|uniref:MerC family mercury resistance protein n=1 Tax=Psychromonas hadalis TaxID=211669 RepID=UPI0003B70866|nr:MerC family mercury resistance protein [Psychromonas hadalis]